MNRKSQVIEELFNICRKKRNLEFHNDLVINIYICLR